VEGDIACLYGNGLSTPIENGAGRVFLISKLLVDKEAYDPNGTFGRFLFGFGVWATR
jgi:hypothetical protein